MAASTSFSHAAALGRICCHNASALADTTHGPSSSLTSSSPCREIRVWRGLNRTSKQRLALDLNSNPSRSPSSLSLSLRLVPRCDSVSDDSPSPASPPRPSPSSAPLESSAPDAEGQAPAEGQLPPREQQRKRPQRREAGSTDWISSSLSRRFGLAGGLAWVGFLAFGVISEQIKTRTEVFLESQGTENVEGSAQEVVLANDVKYVDVRTGGGASPLKGDLVLLDLTGKVRTTGEVFVDTTSAKRPLAFVYGLKPYARGVCYGLEYALQSMKAGGKRKVTVPADQCFGDAGEDLGNGMVVPGGSDIEYEVQLQKVSIAPS